MDRPHALLITWTTYGTWLPGDERGYVSRTVKGDGKAERKRNEFGTPYTKDQGYARAVAVDEQKFATVRLTFAQGVVVAEKLIEAAAGRGWIILQAAIMANHVHVLVSGCPTEKGETRRILKGVTQAGLSKYAGRPGSWWTAGGSDRNKWGEAAIEGVVNYVKGQEWMLVGIEEMKVYVPGRADPGRAAGFNPAGSEERDGDKQG